MSNSSKTSKDQSKEGEADPFKLMKGSLDLLKTALENAKLTPAQLQQLGLVMADISGVLSGTKTIKNLQESLEDFNKQLEETFKEISPCDPDIKQNKSGRTPQ